jgi:hypothetical protein
MYTLAFDGLKEYPFEHLHSGFTITVNISLPEPVICTGFSFVHIYTTHSCFCLICKGMDAWDLE